MNNKMTKADSQAIARELMQKARDLQPVLRERAANTETLRMVDPRTVADFQEAGFFKMFQSSQWGGYECHPADIFKVQEILAQACPSSAWIMGVVGVHNWQLAHFSKQAQDDVWGEDATVLMSSSYAPTGTVEEVEGGCILRGRWFYSSGVDHCDWILVGANIVKEGIALPDYRTYLVPKSDFKIIDDWHVMGLKGTGSKSVEIKEAFVPDHRQLPAIASQMNMTPGMVDGTADAPLFHVPFPTIFGACITTPALGAAQGILDMFTEASKTATSLYSGAKWGQEQVTQMRIAESDAELRGARLQMEANFNEVMATLERGDDLELLDRGRIRFDHCNLVDMADKAADRIFVASGARSLMVNQPIQRLYCDIQAARVHAINNRTKWGSTLGQMAMDHYPDDILSMFI
ncbi:acyl-CoA dehydrogenase family protein [Thalassolituus sp. LLYu03]|uniref:acyl-CoA dehydrogenase family protein n=1 Tax=Thalassolituus sp. LLYu03 TaxID=3421656 RepID=UPI003D27F9B0